MSSSQLDKEVSSLYAVNKNKHGKRAFIKCDVSLQPVLNFSFDMEKSFLFGCFLDSSHMPALQSPSRYLCVAVITYYETWILVI